MKRLSVNWWPGALALLLAACGSTPPRDLPAPPSADPGGRSLSSQCAGKPMSGKGGGYYLDDGPGEAPPFDLDLVADAVPRAEPLHRYANRPYSALGQDFVPLTARAPYRDRGVASWYGRRYHGKATSSGETYDMYGMTAAHPTLPIPSYARVTNLANGCAVVVRINDRGPFKRGRLIDLSYVAAYRLGYLDVGSATVEVEAVFPGEGMPLPVNIAAAPAAQPTPVASPARDEPVAQPVALASPPAGIEARPLADLPPARPAAAAPSSSPAPTPAPVASAAKPPPAAEPAPPRPTPAAAPLNPTAAVSEPWPTPAPMPAPAPAPVAAAPRPALVANAAPSAKGAYVQLGYFASRDNAERIVAQVRSKAADIAARVEMRDEGGRYRVHAGPWSAVDDARAAARRLGEVLGVQPFVVQR